MSGSVPDSQRRLLPRWRGAPQAAACGELKSTKSGLGAAPIVAPDFEALKEQWRADRSVETAAELVGSALVLGRAVEVEDAARILVEPEADVVPLVRQMGERVLGAPPPNAPQTPFDLGVEFVHQRLAARKAQLRAYPRNAIAWMELARGYTVLGQLRNARSAVEIALKLGAENRYVLRCAARFFVHAGEPDTALQVLRRARSLREDPWLIAAELSVALVAGTDPSTYKRAKAIAEADDLLPWHTGELNGALGTLAIHDRRAGKVGRLFSRSLRSPTENAVAQAQWASNSHSAVIVPDELLLDRHTFEASALRARVQRKWDRVIESCYGWGAMEPTSIRPFILGAFSAGVALGDGEVMLTFTNRALLGASGDPMVLNNHAVALAYVGRCDDAEDHLTSIPSHAITDEQRVFVQATHGLVAYRRGDRETGVKHYLAAGELPGAKHAAVKAQLFWALLREEARYNVPGTAELAEELWRRTEAITIPELASLRDGVLRDIARGGVVDAVPTPTAAHDKSSMRAVIAQFPDGTSIRLPDPEHS